MKLGYEPPADLEGWGEIGEYHLDETWQGKVPPAVARARKVYEHLATLSIGLPRGKVGWWEKRARARLCSGNSHGALLEAKAFDIFHRLTKANPFGAKRSIKTGHRTSTLSGRA